MRQWLPVVTYLSKETNQLVCKSVPIIRCTLKPSRGHCCLQCRKQQADRTHGACLPVVHIMPMGWPPGLVLVMGENRQRRLGVTGWEYRGSEIRAPWHCSPDSKPAMVSAIQFSGHRSLSARRQHLPFKPFYQPSRGCELTLAKAANREETFFEALCLFDSWKCYATLHHWFVFISMSVCLPRHVSWILMYNYL